MSDSSMPFNRDEARTDEETDELGEYDALPDGEADVADDPPVLPEFDGVDITKREGPDLEAGPDLDTGAATQE